MLISEKAKHGIASACPSHPRNTVCLRAIWKNVPAFLALSVFAAGCASGPAVQVTQKLDDSADAPYTKILVIALFDSFDARRYLETEIVRHLEEQGTTAVASTTMMRPSTPIVRQTFIDMIEKIGADGLLLTQLTALKSETTAQDARPEATYNYWPTYYWNVWSVELTEYVEPPRILIESTLVLATQAFYMLMQQPRAGGWPNSVWLMPDGRPNAIVTRMKRDGLIER